MFTREKLDKLYKLQDNTTKAKEHASELMRIAKDRYNDREHTITREGKEIKIKESVMWYEVFQIGVASQSGKFLAKKHPQVFEAYKKQDKNAEELKKFCIVELEVDYTQMTISDYTKLTEGMFKLMLKEEGLKHNLPKYWMYKIKKALKIK